MATGKSGFSPGEKKLDWLISKQQSNWTAHSCLYLEQACWSITVTARLKDGAGALGFRDFPGLPREKENRTGIARTLPFHRAFGKQPHYGEDP
jgi:hypothetical protein